MWLAREPGIYSTKELKIKDGKNSPRLTSHPHLTGGQRLGDKHHAPADTAEDDRLTTHRRQRQRQRRPRLPGRTPLSQTGDVAGRIQHRMAQTRPGGRAVAPGVRRRGVRPDPSPGPDGGDRRRSARRTDGYYYYYYSPSFSFSSTTSSSSSSSHYRHRHRHHHRRQSERRQHGGGGYGSGGGRARPAEGRRGRPGAVQAGAVGGRRGARARGRADAPVPGEGRRRRRGRAPVPARGVRGRRGRAAGGAADLDPRGPGPRARGGRRVAADRALDGRRRAREDQGREGPRRGRLVGRVGGRGARHIELTPMVRPSQLGEGGGEGRTEARIASPWERGPRFLTR